MIGTTHFTIDRRQLLRLGAAMALLASHRVPAASAPVQATPAAGISREPTVLVDMLRLIPASLVVEIESGWLWDYMDLAQQFAALGVPQPSIESPLPSGYFNAIYPLWTSSAAYRAATIVGTRESLSAEFVATIGFDPLMVGQFLAVGTAPRSISIYRGGLDPERLADAWTAHDYQPVTTAADVTYWTIGEWNRDDPIQEATFGELNNLAVVDDMVIATGSPERLERVLDAPSAGEPSILDVPELRDAMAGMPAETVSAVGDWPPSSIPMAPDEAFMATQEAIADESGEMPLYYMIVSGVTAGLAAPIEVNGTPTPFEPAPGAGLVVVRLATASEADARQAADVAAYRWQAGTSIRTNRPFTESMEVRSAAADGTVAEIVFDHVRRPNAWLETYIVRDSFPFAVG